MVAGMAFLQTPPLARFGMAIGSACFLAASGLLAAPSAGQKAGSGDDAYREAVAPFLATYCAKCHGGERANGGVTLHPAGEGPRLGRDLEDWEPVLEVLRSEDMPPEDQAQPTAEERARVVRLLDGDLRAAAEARDRAELPTTTRRLTNFEYHNTLRDLFGIELAITESLPEDPTHPYEFNNNARFLLLGLEQFDRYGEIARTVMDSVIVEPVRPEPRRQRQAYGLSAGRGMPDPTTMQSDEIGVFGNRNRTVWNGMQVRNSPTSGEFLIRVQASAILPPGVKEVPLEIRMGYDIEGINANATNRALTVDTLRLSNTVDEPEIFELRGRLENFPYQPEYSYRRGGKIDGALVVVPDHFTVTPVNVYDDGTLNDAPDPLAMPRAVVEWIEFEGPVANTWPPEHHSRILFDSPLRETDERAYVAEVLRHFLPRAFRRPAEEDEVERFVQVFEIVSEALGLETLEEGMRETLAAVLISPDFLLHTTSAGPGNGTFELASRLSYFLWGSMPDDELFALAADGTLRDADVVERQARRMLADPRARDFIGHFTEQWLGLDRLAAVPIDLKRFPRFLYTIKRGERSGREMENRPTIRDWMHGETLAFMAELVRRNGSVLELVDSDFAMLNQPLAAHYGVEGVQGNHLRPVEIGPEHHLGGLLTQGSILVGTGTGSAPHPIYRAVWLREAILGDEVADPPADVPALEDSAGVEAVATATTLKDLLRLHRTKESCNDCHAGLDPWGIPFERYDATGRFHPRVPPSGTRVQGFLKADHGDQAGYRAYLEELSTVEIDAASRVPHGPTGGAMVDGMRGLKDHLLGDRRDDIATNVTRRLMTYALGRDLTLRDRFAVEELVRATAPKDHPLQDLIVAVCRSDAFLGKSDQHTPSKGQR